MIIPLLTLIIYLAMVFVPYIMVYKENFKKFEKYYDDFKLVIALFFTSLYIFMLLPNFGLKINMNYFMVPVMAILFYYIGYIMPKLKRNYIIGIRTQWTLANENVWDKTHKNSAWLFKIGGLFFILAAIFNEYFLWIILFYFAFIIIYILVYSYTEYTKEGIEDGKASQKGKAKKRK